ncbi:MAG: LPS export ABC transporter periplasmic protein LptC [Prevotellaceae bacterium]|jgi:LPS export ABC transporter protein LptC|nr:LPS export ABC transporter periplasmic protein LptC [Prevotellaceae bacterium]
MRKQFISRFRTTALLCAVAMAACDKDNTGAQSIEDVGATPTMQVQHVDVKYTEYGKVKMKLTAPTLLRYLMAKEPYSVFPKGFVVELLTPGGAPETRITADYAQYKEDVEIWQTIGHVVVINYEQQQKLFTDTLYWNRKEHTIYTNAPVRVEAGDDIHFGRNGMTADEKFTDIEMRQMGGDSRLYFDDTPQTPDTLTKP